MSRYRYYGPSLSRTVLPALDKHLPKIGCPVKVEARCEGVGHGWYELVVTGMLGKLVLRGCSWGYHGEGSRATEAVLRRLGLDWDAATLSYQTPNQEVGIPAGKGKVFFRRALLPQVPAGRSYSVVEGRVVLGETFSDKGVDAGQAVC